MQIARMIARIVLGIAFIAFAGLSFMPPPPAPGLMGTFSDLFYRSHWGMFIAAAQFAAGVMLLLNRYVTLAVVILFAFLYNSFAFHLTTSPQMLPMPIVVAALLIFVAWPYRAAFTQFFTAKADEHRLARP